MMKVFNYCLDQWADTSDFGFVIGPNCQGIVAEDGNRPGDVEFFDSEEDCKEFCNKMNSEEGTCFFRLHFDPKVWEKVQAEINVLEAEKTLKTELEKSQDDEFWFAEEMKLRGVRLR